MIRTFVLGIGIFLSLFYPHKTLAILAPVKPIYQKVQIIPTATPSMVLIRVPSLKIIKVVKTETSTPTVSVEPLVTTEPLATPTMTLTLTPTLTPVPTTTEDGSGSKLTFWFLVTTIGLLAVIIVIQAWPKNDDSDSSN